MALDVQRNWDISMADNLRKLTVASSTSPQRKKPASSKQPTDHNKIWRPSVYLPDEIVLQILEYVDDSDEAQQTLHSCTLLSHQWYIAAVPLLFARPYLYGSNFDPFVRSICPSINLHVRKSPLAALVKVLHMGGLVHQGSKSITARLLGRTKDNLEVFVAPQSSFAINCFPALAKCKRLRKLDLSLVSEAASLQLLFSTVKGLQDLRELRLPRSSGFGPRVEPADIVWPPHLERLFLSGGIDAHFLYGVVHLPDTLQELTMEHCPFAKTHAMRQFLETMAKERVPLRKLKLAHMQRLASVACDFVLKLMPELEFLSVSVDYISPNLIDAEFQQFENELKLSTLELTNSGNPGIEDKLSPLDIMIAMDEGTLPNLRRVRVAKSLGWDLPTAIEEFDALSDQLRDSAQRRRVDEGDSPPDRVARSGGEALRVSKAVGAWTFEG